MRKGMHNAQVHIAHFPHIEFSVTKEQSVHSVSVVILAHKIGWLAGWLTGD